MEEETMEAVETAAQGLGRPEGSVNGAPQRSDDQVRESIRRAVVLGQITEQQGEAIFWLHGFALDNNLSNRDLAAKMQISDSTVSMVFSGKYAASDWSKVISKIDALKAVEDANVRSMNLGFVETETAQTIFKACDAALLDGMPTFIYGASQLGKTTALLEYKRTHNHGRTKYLRLGSHWSKARLVRELARACNCSQIRQRRTWELEDKISDSLNRYNLLIIDEFHLAMETVSVETSREVVEYIREVYDRTVEKDPHRQGCGLVLSSTKVGIEDLEQGKNKMLFDQFRRRGIVKVVLPDVPKVKDINAIAKHFALPLPQGEVLREVKELLKARGLGVFVKYLQKASSIVAAKQKQLEWEDFFYVCRGYAALAMMKNEY